jgi:Gamma tubulin complex component C-terminal
MVPGFLGRDVASKVFEMGCGLRLLWRCRADHPLCDGFEGQVGEGMDLKWLLSWDEIHGTHVRLDSYAEEMWTRMEQYAQTSGQTRAMIQQFRVNDDDVPDFGLYESKEAAEQMLSTTMAQMSLVSTTPADPLISDFTSLHTTLSSSRTSPSLSLIAQNSFTHALDIQSNLIQHALQSLFFNSLSLRGALTTLHSYLLFGNGVFVTRLTEALFEDFDEEDVRGGGQPGLGLGMGIKNVDTWPPSGAKVGLVLRNILSEHTSEGISFAYRELSDAQFEKVKNPIGTRTPMLNY